MENSKIIRRITIQGMIVEAFYWFGFAAYVSFLVTTLLDYGWSASAASGLMTVVSVITMIIHPVVGFITDKYLSEKQMCLLMVGLSAAALALFPFTLRSGSILLTGFHLLFISIPASMGLGLLDSWLVGLKNEFPSLNYGMLRGSGSFTFALSSYLMGQVTVRFGHEIRLWIAAGMLILAIVASLFLRPGKKADNTENEAELTGKTAAKLVFSNRPYVVLTAVVFCILLGSNAFTSIFQIQVGEFGGTSADVGLITAVGAISEVPCMFLMAYVIKKIREPKLIIFCAGAYVVRMLLSAFAGSIGILAVIQVMSALTYAVLTPVAMSYLARIVDTRVRSTAVSSYSAITNNISGILSNLTTTVLLASGLTGGDTLIVFSVFALIGLIIAAVALIKKIW